MIELHRGERWKLNHSGRSDRSLEQARSAESRVRSHTELDSVFSAGTSGRRVIFPEEILEIASRSGLSENSPFTELRTFGETVPIHAPMSAAPKSLRNPRREVDSIALGEPEVCLCASLDQREGGTEFILGKG